MVADLGGDEASAARLTPVALAGAVFEGATSTGASRFSAGDWASFGSATVSGGVALGSSFSTFRGSGVGDTRGKVGMGSGVAPPGRGDHCCPEEDSSLLRTKDAAAASCA